MLARARSRRAGVLTVRASSNAALEGSSALAGVFGGVVPHGREGVPQGGVGLGDIGCEAGGHHGPNAVAAEGNGGRKRRAAAGFGKGGAAFFKKLSQSRIRRWY